MKKKIISNIPLHPALQIALAQLPAHVVVHALVAAQALQVFLHDRLALGLMVERERAALRRDRLGRDLAATGPAERAHDWLAEWRLSANARRRNVDVLEGCEKLKMPTCCSDGGTRREETN